MFINCHYICKFLVISGSKKTIFLKTMSVANSKIANAKFPWHVLTTKNNHDRQSTITTIMKQMDWPFQFHVNERRHDNDGMAGCTEAHLRIVLYCITEKLPFIAVLEDNAVLSHQFNMSTISVTSAKSVKSATPVRSVRSAANQYYNNIVKFLNQCPDFDILFTTSNLMGIKNHNFDLAMSIPNASNDITITRKKCNVLDNCHFFLKKTAGVFSGATAYIISAQGCHKILQAVQYDLERKTVYSEKNFFQAQKKRQTLPTIPSASAETEVEPSAKASTLKTHLVKYENHPMIKNLWHFDLYMHYWNMNVYLSSRFLFCRGNIKTTNSYKFLGIEAKGFVNLLWKIWMNPKSFLYFSQEFFYRVLDHTRIKVENVYRPLTLNKFGIPNIIFKTHADSSRKCKHYNHAHLSWIKYNPEWSIVYLDNNERELIMIKKYLQTLPKVKTSVEANANIDAGGMKFIIQEADRIEACYKKLKPGAYKSDLSRAVLLYIYGGVYVDSDAECFMSLDDVFASISATMSSKSDVESTTMPTKSMYKGLPTFLAPRDTTLAGVCLEMHNGFFICQPKHPFLRQWILDMLTNIENNYYGLNPLAPTGPICFGQAIRKTIQSQECQRRGQQDQNCQHSKIPIVSGTISTNPQPREKFKTGRYSQDLYVFDYPGTSKVYVSKGGRYMLNKKFSTAKAIRDKFNPNSYPWQWMAKNIYHL